ncbi:hypothetical protein [Hymenobacter arcticus]
MRFFTLFFAAATILCAILWLIDGAGSGMAWPTSIFAAIGSGTLLYNKLRTGRSLHD